MGGPFIPDPSRPHLRYPRDFLREARARAEYRIARILGQWKMKKMADNKQDAIDRLVRGDRDWHESVHSHLIGQVQIAKQDAIDRLVRGDRDWHALRKAIVRYVEFQTAADVLSGQTKIAPTLSG